MKSWEELVESKKKFLNKQIPEEWILQEIKSPDEEPNVCVYLDKLLDEREIYITNLTLDELLSEQLSGKLSALEIAKAFTHRAALTHQITNCCTELFFDQAYQQAERLDKYLSETGKLIGPFHGIPVSLKDQLNVKGVATSIGYVHKLFNVVENEEDEAVLVKQLRLQGALLYMKTTVPMAMLLCDTFSGAYGYTQNALNRRYSPGGSSGGEGVVVKAKACILGIGTDIGGSLRAPAIYNGIWSIRPTANRFSYLNALNSWEHQDINPSTIGPMANRLEDLEYFGKHILGDDFQWTHDPKVPPIPWKVDVEIPKKLAFGFQKWNNIVMPHPPIVRMMEVVKKALIEQGHEIIEYEPPISDMELFEFSDKVFGVDGYLELDREVANSGEPVLMDELYSSTGSRPKPITSIEPYWELAGQKYRYQQTFAKYWLSTKEKTSTGRPIDALLTPAWNCCATRLGKVPKINADYAVQYNVLDLPAIPIPVGTVDSKIDPKDPNYKPVNHFDQDCYDRYDAEFFDGANISVQIVGLQKFTEERLLKLAGVVRDSIKH
ncbi:hypothetical protein WICANDRAFT_86346 [Wickerhamomyces anomalus NRRL Y-366-8]|uniref:Amidase domain-containing protein n=1 Tax=Wickerhamomyces anomalus (strain ATCC 58044 / CBS 1984 / NCYC 433 / NRRL Y-366-8) TaxID=683960 RepID=A0A1E3NU95_WICAA|nr:uncharacterized protein WICANDRAFT_86346 [Wickerhamomyces anomalus NRRL Y-366-8]ODQ56696.1 hypothetical protein WICANDRAFT_86346 [Wickerhamomyces anomalus NRRL Y-366-8]